MNREIAERRKSAVAYLAYGLGTFVAVLLVFAACDDITTDNATTFHTEYTVLTACTAYLAFVAGDLLRVGHRLLGATSLLALAGGIWAQRAIGPGIIPGLWPEYVVATAAIFWFVALAFVLLWRARRESVRGKRVTA